MKRNHIKQVSTLDVLMHNMSRQEMQLYLWQNTNHRRLSKQELRFLGSFTPAAKVEKS